MRDLLLFLNNQMSTDEADLKINSLDVSVELIFLKETKKNMKCKRNERNASEV